ncbi:hypothetical protein V8E55_009215 [Tylopilus felleus]
MSPMFFPMCLCNTILGRILLVCFLWSRGENMTTCVHEKALGEGRHSSARLCGGRDKRFQNSLVAACDKFSRESSQTVRRVRAYLSCETYRGMKSIWV